MKAVVVLMAAGLAACGGPPDQFDILVAEGAATSATLRLCDREVPLARHGNRFTGRERIRCEGTGEIVVAFPDRQPVSCNVGYVTPSAGQSWGYVVEKGVCRDA